ncbi:hypothetical protein PQX77_002050 [Marasmius sp. AFHP31]|nr:hypothetical protein PQX77_002050 [Marasmius sp. AFHP31]
MDPFPSYAFFARERYPESDLDLYVDLGGYHRLMEFLQGVGYGFEAIQVERKKQPSDFGEAIEQMEARVQQEVAGPGFNELDASPEDGDRTILPPAAVMNDITARHAISLYPKSTYIQEVSVVNQQNHSSHQEDVYKKYENRGLEILKEPDVLASLEAGSAFDPTINRQPGDRNCWIIPLSVFTEVSSTGSNDIGPIQMHSWSFLCDLWPGIVHPPFTPPDTWTLVRLRDTLALLASEYPQSFQIMRCVLVPNRCKQLWVNIRVKITLPEGSTFDGTRYLSKIHRMYSNVEVEDQNGVLVYQVDPMGYINSRNRRQYVRPLRPPLLSTLPFEF